ncbi:MAG: hypothetical protein ACKN9I_04065, partial [Alphaproteobacteria bacterium]
EYYKEKEKLATKQMRNIRQNTINDINADWKTRQEAINKLCEHDKLGECKEIKELKKNIDKKCNEINRYEEFRRWNDIITKRELEGGEQKKPNWTDTIRNIIGSQRGGGRTRGG